MARSNNTDGRREMTVGSTLLVLSFALCVIAFASIEGTEAVVRRDVSTAKFSNIAPAAFNACLTCDYVVKFAEVVIKAGNLNETQILTELKRICNFLTGSEKFECEIFMSTVAAAIVNSLINGANPDTVCQNYKLCGHTNSTAPFPLPREKVPMN